MKMRLFCLIPLLLCLPGTGDAWAGHCRLVHDDFSLNFEGGTLFLQNGARHRETVEITADLELYVDGKEIQTDRKDRKLLKAYYDKAGDIEEVAVKLGAEGARLGVKGAALGIQALGKVLHLLSDDYDTEDLEAEIEAETEQIEVEAEGIEEAAEILEEWVEDLGEIADELQERIPELEELDWF